MTNCPNCGSPVSGSFCSMCGFSLAAVPPPPAQQPQYSQPPPPPQQPQYTQQPYQQPGQPYPYQPPEGGSKTKFIGIIVGLIVAVVVIALLFVFLGGERVGTCVVHWGGGTPTQYMEGWTQAECEAECEELQHEQSCYWEG